MERFPFFLPLNAGMSFTIVGVFFLIWSVTLWKTAGIRIEANQWYERYFLGSAEYYEECWMLYISWFMTVYKWDSRVHEAETGTSLDDDTTVVAQIFLSDEHVDIAGVHSRLSQSFVLGILIS